MSRKGFPAHFGSILTVRIRSIPSQKLNGDFFKEQALQNYLVVHQTITPIPPLGLAHPQGVKATGQEGTMGPLAHSDLCTSVLSLCTFDFHLWFSNLHPGSPKESRTCLSYITDAPTPRPWDSRVVLPCHL